MMNIWQGLSYFWSYFTPFSFVTAYFGVDAVFKTRQGTQKVMPVNVSTIDMGETLTLNWLTAQGM